jgi:hypothetical protein
MCSYLIPNTIKESRVYCMQTSDIELELSPVDCTLNIRGLIYMKCKQVNLQELKLAFRPNAVPR